ncbi:hypothetical protein E0H56_03910 [Rhizobium leguminosarum bv. viciae]|uniref:hypothetical protein n=1 Tax=Rhizobium leguminosarum TaxID=384 RepID=UPI001039B4D8|nr:hypothetical protein [Rhizobium leguminosarum]TBZ98262.1 hypothetical protein E0H56_03910 [Rhizobium leguminosarum bv. viciae]
MRPYVKAAGRGAAIGALLAMFVFPVWQAWINQFQGLITGLAAVGAAAFTIAKMEKTIRVMERTDSASERRHRQLISTQLRPDRLKVSRALHPQIEDLRHIQFQLHDFYNVGSQLPPGQESLEWRWLTEVSKRYHPCFEDIRRVLNRQQFREGVGLFDGITTRYLDELVERNDATLAALKRHLGMNNPFSGVYNERAHYVEHFEETYRRFEFVITATMGLLPRLIESLEFTDRSYADEMS